MLSEKERKFVIFVTKSNIKDYIAEEQLFTHMGGKDTFEYRYERLSPTPKKELSFDSINNSNVIYFRCKRLEITLNFEFQ